MKKFIVLIFALLTALSFFTSCRKKTSDSDSSFTSGNLSDFNYKQSSEETNFIKIEMEDGGVILIELYPETAPITVRNFKDLVSKKYYDGLIFHRVIKNFMIQGGAGKTTPSIKGEFSANGVENNLKHERGVISMARTNIMDSASSQFFICHNTEKCTHLDGKYAAFGKVIAGMDTVDKIASVSTDLNDKPLTEQKIKTIRFVTIENAPSEPDSAQNVSTDSN